MLGAGSIALFRSAGNLLIRDDQKNASPEFAVLLMGDLVPRTDLALSLLKSGTVKKIVFFRPVDSALNIAKLTENEGDLTIRYLLEHGGSASDLEYITSTHNSSTKQEAMALLHWVQGRSLRPSQIGIVTSWYHTSRSAWIFEKALSGQGISVAMYPAFGRQSMPDTWWNTEQGFLEVFNEYLKWLYYLAKY